jgi:hypothetical protein
MRWLVVVCAACGTHAAAPPVPAANVPIRVAPSPSAAPEAPPVAARSIADEDWPRKLEGERPNPSLATLRGVNAREAWVAFTLFQDESYDAIVDLTTGCITETFTPSSVLELSTTAGANDDEIATALGSDLGRRALGPLSARLARFEWNTIDVVMTRGHSDGYAAVSSDHATIAITVQNRIFLSTDGGAHFARADEGSPAAASGLRLASDRWLGWIASGPSKIVHASIDTRAKLPAQVGRVDIQNYTSLRVSLDGLFLLAHTTDRCVYGIDPTSAALRRVQCVEGPPIGKGNFFYVTPSPSGRFVYEIQGDFQASRGIVAALAPETKPRVAKGAFDLHNTHVGPDDEGRVAWERAPNVLRIDGPSGIRDHKMGGRPLGFDLEGNVLVFREPPLVKPHVPMTPMPRAKGKLEEQRCKLIGRAGHSAGGS